MTTFDTDPTIANLILWKIGKVLQRRERRVKVAKESSNRVTAVLGGIVRLLLHLAGFGLLTMAAFHANTIAGYAVAGISCFALSTLMRNGGDTDGPSVSRNG